MDNYIVSARKYRPSTFDSVVGQKALTTSLKNAIISGKLAHAYLFCGPRGVGKTSCARIFAKAINCLNPRNDGEACNECESCKAFNEQRSYNIHELDAASNNSVDGIRALIEEVRIPPALGKYKVFIIDEVHMLSPAAFNAFLKTLEEPPKHAIFILATTEKQKVLPTILSRCQIYDFTRISVEDIVKQLEFVASSEGIQAETDALNVIAQKADGGMRDALSVFDQVSSFTNGNITYQAVIANLNVLDYDYYFRFLKAFLKSDVRQALLLLNEILLKGFDGQNIVTGLASFLRDLLVCKDPSTLILIDVGASVRERYQAAAKLCGDRWLFRALEITNTCDLNYKSSRNKRLLVELTLIQLCQLSLPETDPASTMIDSSKKKIELKPITSAASSTDAPQVPVAEVPTEAAPLPSKPAVAPKIDEKKTKALAGLNTISLKGYPNAKDPSNGPSTNDAAAQPRTQQEPYTEADLIRCWDSFANTQLQQDYFKSTMLMHKPQIGEDDRFVIKVQNPTQQDNLAGNSSDILNYIRKELHNSHISMVVEVEENPTIENNQPMIYTAQEKLQYLINENPAMLTLKNRFHLTPE